MKIPNQEKIWDKIAGHWTKFRNKPFPHIAKFLKKQKGKILDIGCGSGRNFIKSKNLYFYGIDFSKELLEHAKKKNIAIELKKANATKIPFKENFFNAVIFNAVLHCIPKATDRKKSLQELYRVLKPKSQALISVWSRNSKRIKNKPKESLIPWTIEDKKYYRYYYIYDKKELLDLIEDTGFKILKSWEDENINVVVEKCSNPKVV